MRWGSREEHRNLIRSWKLNVQSPHDWGLRVWSILEVGDFRPAVCARPIQASSIKVLLLLRSKAALSKKPWTTRKTRRLDATSEMHWKHSTVVKPKLDWLWVTIMDNPNLTNIKKNILLTNWPHYLRVIYDYYTWFYRMLLPYIKHVCSTSPGVPWCGLEALGRQLWHLGARVLRAMAVLEGRVGISKATE